MNDFMLSDKTANDEFKTIVLLLQLTLQAFAHEPSQRVATELLGGTEGEFVGVRSTLQIISTETFEDIFDLTLDDSANSNNDIKMRLMTLGTYASGIWLPFAR